MKREKARKRIKKAIKLFVIATFLVVAALGVTLAGVYFQVSGETADRIERGAINRIIFSESPVYYNDGESVIGVFFEKTHRKYIEYKDIPQNFLKAIVAAEDKNFFSHHGFDLRAILRAMIANIKAGAIVQGGSTITQQTAKNVFKRERRSFRAKLRELVQAILLEQKYSKEEILEMYINQFFVTGFGRGLRIASRYFFDKEAQDLDLVEAAFIAGCVKGPFRYNPFIKKTAAEREKTLQRAKKRKDYVLRNMFRMGMISEDQYLDAREREVPFKQGKVTYRLNVILDYIRDQLESDFFRSILQEQGIDNIATSGMRIYTSINRDIQEGALESIRRHLPVLDVKVSGYDQETLQAKKWYEKTSQGRTQDGLPFLGRVTHINTDPTKPHMVVSWGDGGGIIDYEGLKPIARAWANWKHGRRPEPERKGVVEFLQQFRIGDIVAARIVNEAAGRASGQGLQLSKFPELQGGIVVIKDGMIKAMVGGFYNRFFNRALDAKRQLGSIFKPLVYTAALKLKWNNLDPLSNVRDLFPFETTYYFPNPDHKPAAERVSMAWAGAMSENLATVWLLYHLSDRLNMSEFRRLAETVGLSRREGEAYEAYVRRIRDHHGVVVDREAIMNAAFEEAKKVIKPDLIFEGDERLLENMRRIHFKMDPALVDPSNPDEVLISRFDFQRLGKLNDEMIRKLSDLRNGLGEVHRETHNGFYYFLEKEGHTPRVVYGNRGSVKQWAEGFVAPIPLKQLRENGKDIRLEDVWVDNIIPSKYVVLLQSHTNSIYQRMANLRKYDPELLYRIRDFRTLVNLRFVTQLAEDMGISTPLDPVLSFPLGASSISILEAALAYHTMMTGKIYPLGGSLTAYLVPVITKITDREGEVVWEYRPRPRRVLSQEVMRQVTEILRLVMTRGTGRRARDAVQISFDVEGEKIRAPIPTYGKTGTANRFTNSSFVGFVPGPKGDSGQLGLQQGYVIASYVGFDDNRPMKAERIAIYGASGALPLWIDTANTTVNSAEYKRHLQVADFVFGSRPWDSMSDEGMQPVLVSKSSGLPLRNQDLRKKGEDAYVLSYTTSGSGSVELRRIFEPH
ncbi:MAG: transglycosylase domain-containing protein [Deltaproteobacteria bacterium]|nr:transglycosylase domain-containing protein [Deltaproteobacteria bacterium]MBW2136093.1 transglycosylase domain-containing protein [Deltaproteobacteria bacterium]